MELVWPRDVDVKLFGPNQRSEAGRVPETPSVGLALNSNANGASKGSLLLDEKTTVDRPVILYVGRISYEENLLLLLHSFSTLLRSLPSTTLRPKLVLIGEGPARGELQSLCQTLGLEEGGDVMFEGACSGNRLAEGYASADIFASPSFTETCSQGMLEALTWGLPIVGLDAPATRDLVTPSSTGLLLSPPPPSIPPITASSPLLPTSRTPPPSEWSHVFANRKSPSPILVQQYANLLARLVLNPALRASMSRRAVAQCLSWNNSTDRTLAQSSKLGIQIPRVEHKLEDGALDRRLTQIGIWTSILGIGFLCILFI